MDEFNPGDVVRLKAGGCKMTVERVEDDFIYVVWFDEANNLRRDRVPPIMLELSPRMGSHQ